MRTGLIQSERASIGLAILLSLGALLIFNSAGWLRCKVLKTCDQPGHTNSGHNEVQIDSNIKYIQDGLRRVENRDPDMIEYSDLSGGEPERSFLDLTSIAIDKTCDWTMCTRGMVHRYKTLHIGRTGENWVEEWLGICYPEEMEALFDNALYIDNLGRVTRKDRLDKYFVDLPNDFLNNSNTMVSYRRRQTILNPDTGRVAVESYADNIGGFSSTVFHPGLNALLRDGQCNNYFKGGAHQN